MRLPLGVTRLPAAAVRGLLKVSAKQPRSNKYGAIRTEALGRTFDSKKEATRYVELRRLEDAKLIFDLECQPVYPLVVNGIRIGEYRGDFQWKTPQGRVVLADAKGYKTPVYRMKKKLVGALYGIEIKEL